MSEIRIKSALISVFDKGGLNRILDLLGQHNIEIYSTGGTQKFIEENNGAVNAVEGLTNYPSILDGRVKTLHPKVFGGILARREEGHLTELSKYEIPEIDLVIVDLYPFEDTLQATNDEQKIIEKIDIGGIALIRAAAKNFNDVLVIPSKSGYSFLENILENMNATTTIEDRKKMAAEAFNVSSHYDSMIFKYFNQEIKLKSFKESYSNAEVLRYGENPHQQAVLYGQLSEIMEKLGGKPLSYNNIVDIDAAVQIMAEYQSEGPTFAILKHTNACGVASRDNIFDAYLAALAGDPISAFGGILISNKEIDVPTAEKINELFYEVLIAPSFLPSALDILQSKKKRIILKLKAYPDQKKMFKTVLGRVIEQDVDRKMEGEKDLTLATKVAADKSQVKDLLFANKCVKHLKSNGIALVKENQLIGMGCGQTSRVDALKQAINKAKAFGFTTEGAVMASDAFFPFPDCVEIADQAGIKAVIQPGGSIKDKLSIDYCDDNGMVMVMTGTRHFKH